MIRKAILIGNPKKTEDGTSSKNNISFLSYFLKSTVGGCWHNDEIIILNRPTASELFSVINNCTETFRFIFYSGHGCISNGKQYILIGDELVNISRILNRIPQEIAIFDCCRNEVKYEALKNKYSLIESKLNSIERVRKQYHEIISKNNASFIAFTTSIGKPAYSYSKCSYFILVFAKVLKQLRNANLYKVISIQKFLKLISLVMKRTVRIQEITYSYIETSQSLI